MDDKFKNLSFSDFVTVDYAQLDDELAAYRRKRLKNGAMHEQVEEEVDEALTHAQRIKAGQRMKRMSKRIAMAKKRALKRAPTMDALKKRARKQVKSQMVKKWTRGQDKGDLSFGRRTEIEKKLKRMDKKITNLAKRKMPEVRKQDRERRAAMSANKDNK